MALLVESIIFEVVGGGSENRIIDNFDLQMSFKNQIVRFSMTVLSNCHPVFIIEKERKCLIQIVVPEQNFKFWLLWFITVFEPYLKRWWVAP